MPFGRTAATPPTDDLALTRRIIAAYRAAALTPLEPSRSLARRFSTACRSFSLAPFGSLRSLVGFSGSFWLNAFAELKRDVHDALMGDDETAVQALLRDPGKTDLSYGFENLARSAAPSPEGDEIPFPVDEERTIAELSDLLLRLCEARGLWRLGRSDEPVVEPPPGIDAMLAALDESFGNRCDFPNPFPGEIGLSTSRGVASYRAMQALYQAGRVVDLVAGRAAPRVLEIGAGLGRTAYYAWLFGIRDYTIVDLPMSSVASANFLGRTVGEHHIQLYGEPEAADIRILPPAAFLNADDRYDLIINVDSLTEMAPITAWQYIKETEMRGSVFWSVNHELNSIKVRDLFGRREAKNVVRTPYCMREGYFEELLDQRPQ